ncbi:SET domain-containing protein [Rhodofomes roseus]|uniref:SET domain-containing protein n=1 Tax=Rhodofomes roseus TaxID=34475 RepID=A0ABQ8KNU9_9APHY|nr:SET domain-containing protein [Rhodofomes roseus]KAH9840107.1 SET domain-containing protein [Rhodofomes roseus]
MAATCSVSEPLKNGLDDTSTPLLRVEIHDHSGRSYHAARTIPAGTTILEVDTPYAYTIWKPFRNEVCAECWRYDGGRRSFLTRKDDEGVSEESAEGSGGGALPSNGQDRPGVGAGLWFCDANCQGRWLGREGRETMRLLRVLEEARRQKEGDKDKDGGFRLEDLGQTELSRENVDRAWEMVAQKERSPKEVRKWRNIQLDHFETDVARYVLIALVHRHREAHGEMDWERGRQMQAGEDIIDRSSVQEDTNTIVQFGGARWKDFAALQSNELRHLNAYPELLENQIRAYQALKGRFSSSHIRASTSERRTGSTDGRGEAQLAGGDQQSHNPQPLHIGQGDIGAFRDFGSMVTIDNVRGAFRVDPGNSFGIWETPMTDESELMGFAVYPKPSFFNHHCSPNVTKIRKGRTLGFVTTRPIEAGEELCISYGHVEMMSLQERQRELREGWFFDCRCSRCVAEAETHNFKGLQK